MQEEESPLDDLLAQNAPATKNDGGKEPLVATEGERQLESEPSATPAARQDTLSPTRPVIRTPDGGPPGVTFMQYESELQLPHIMRLMKADLSEPYSIYTYRYFIHNWPNLCFLV